MGTKVAIVELFETPPEHKTQVGGVPYVCKHIAEKLRNGVPVVESITTGVTRPGEFAGVCSQCAEDIRSKRPQN
jgi:hypothetical protein